MTDFGLDSFVELDGIMLDDAAARRLAGDLCISCTS